MSRLAFRSGFRVPREEISTEGPPESLRESVAGAVAKIAKIKFRIGRSFTPKPNPNSVSSLCPLHC
jgi:hypothetical protein